MSEDVTSEQPHAACQQCGADLPDGSPATPSEPQAEPSRERDAVCSQCGGPAAAGCRIVPVGDLYGREIPWPVCAVCDRVAQGPRPEVTVVHDVLVERVQPERLPRALELLDELTAVPAPHPCAYVEITWSALVQRLPGLGPYHRVAPRADPRNEPLKRWEHLEPQLVARIAELLEHAHALRVPVPPTLPGPCVLCGRAEDLPLRWGTLSGRPVCGPCQDGMSEPVPVHLDPGRMGAY